MRISRPCYDKPHRCPSWAGGGARYARVNRCRCTGSLVDIYERRGWYWRPYRNRACGLLVLPYAVCWLDWRHWSWQVRDWARRFEDWRYWR